ncbi:MAG: universal stress protein [Alkalilacustris sp.]
MRTIIAASDLTPLSQEVAGRALAVAAQTGARVLLAHAVPPGAAPAVIEKARAALHAALDGRPAEVCILSGPPEIALRDLCRAEDGALVVLGLHKFRRVLDMLGLTTMERIVLRAPVPVLIAHRPASRPYRVVLSSTDFAPACAAALAAAAQLAGPGAEFHAIHALQLGLRDKFSHGGVEASRSMTAAQALSQAFVAMPGVPALRHPPEIVPGGVHEVLSFRLEELQPDLLAIGTHSGRDPETLGNYARDLMREPPTDVVVAKPPPP